MNETREEIGRMISSSLGSRDGEVDGRVAEAVGHLEDGEGLEKVREVFAEGRENRPWYKRGWMLCLWGLLLVVGIWFLSVVSFDPKAKSATYGLSAFQDELLAMRVVGEKYNFSDEQKLFLGGDPYKLWMSDESNKEYAAEYVYSHHMIRDVFPDELLEIGEFVDPDNPWYLYMRVDDLVGEAVSKVKKKGNKKIDPSLLGFK